VALTWFSTVVDCHDPQALQALGVTRIDIGQGDAEWIVMADPEGNEFCVLAPQAGW